MNKNIEDKLQQLEQLTMQKITNPQNLEYITTKPKRKYFQQRVAQYDINGHIIRTYNSVKETKECGYNQQCVSMCINKQMKLHDNNIFIKLKGNQKAAVKIDPTPYITRKNSPVGINNLITNDIINTTKPEVVNTVIPKVTPIETPKQLPKPKSLNKAGVGMFLKNGILVNIFHNDADIIKEFGYTSSVYDHLYGRIKTKSKLKNGYKNKFFFRKMETDMVYTIGQKYNLNDFPQAVSKRNKNNTPTEITKPVKIPKVKNQDTKKKTATQTIDIPEVNRKDINKINISVEVKDKKRNFFQRLVYLFRGI